MEKVRPAKGFGRWVYCKYCGKNVRPMLSGINQIVCSECGYGLTPDFLKLENLKRWMEGDESALDDDSKFMRSPEGRRLLEEHLRKTTWKMEKGGETCERTS